MSLGYSSAGYKFSLWRSTPPAYLPGSSSSDNDLTLSSLDDSLSPEDQVRPVTRAQSKQVTVPKQLRYTPYVLHQTEATEVQETTMNDSKSVLSSASTSGGSVRRPPPFEGWGEAKEMPAEQYDTMMPFIRRLRNMLADEEGYSDVLRWDEAGTSFIVRFKSERLLDEVFPEAYGHSKYPSFTRQLNIYGFTRLSETTLASLLEPDLSRKDLQSLHGWTHPSFYRGAAPSPFPSHSYADSSAQPNAQDHVETPLPWDVAAMKRMEADRKAHKAAAAMRPRESPKRLEKKRLKGMEKVEGGLSTVKEEEEEYDLSWLEAGPSKRRRKT